MNICSNYSPLWGGVLMARSRERSSVFDVLGRELKWCSQGSHFVVLSDEYFRQSFRSVDGYDTTCRACCTYGFGSTQSPNSVSVVPALKQCSRCGRLLRLAQRKFPSARSSPDGFGSVCEDCLTDQSSDGRVYRGDVSDALPVLPDVPSLSELFDLETVADAAIDQLYHSDQVDSRLLDDLVRYIAGLESATDLPLPLCYLDASVERGAVLSRTLYDDLLPRKHDSARERTVGSVHGRSKH
jgi:hypothetical protein